MKIDRTRRPFRASAPPRVQRPPNLEDLAFWPVTSLSVLIRTRQATSVELTEMYLARAKRYNPKLKCFVTITDDLALREARQADKEIAAGKYRGPLHGIPYGIKDLFAVKGYPTTWGAAPFKDRIIDVDATVVTRLRDAGAVLIGKLATGELALDDIWFAGQTMNPWDTSMGSQGSSAGPGSATAGGLVGFSIGTETLGSILAPSAICGVTGLRPTFGRVSRYGAMALSWSMDKTGPMCRSVEDCALVLNAIQGADNLDLAAVDVPFNWDATLDVRKLRVAYLKAAFENTRRRRKLRPMIAPRWRRFAAWASNWRSSSFLKIQSSILRRFSTLKALWRCMIRLTRIQPSSRARTASLGKMLIVFIRLRTMCRPIAHACC
jgi:Asp-tRNA(Asn)/Glu-tRNA(Gln) amidotransferase A subunit family amidase